MFLKKFKKKSIDYTVIKFKYGLHVGKVRYSTYTMCVFFLNNDNSFANFFLMLKNVVEIFYINKKKSSHVVTHATDFLPLFFGNAMHLYRP